MAKVNRSMIGEPIKYRGHLIEVRHSGSIDVLLFIDGNEQSNWFITPEDARSVGRRICDEIEAEKEKKDGNP